MRRRRRLLLRRVGVSKRSCSSDCTVEEGYVCSGSPSVCVDVESPYIVRMDMVDGSNILV